MKHAGVEVRFTCYKIDDYWAPWMVEVKSDELSPKKHPSNLIQPLVNVHILLNRWIYAPQTTQIGPHKLSHAKSTLTHLFTRSTDLEKCL